MSSRNDRDDDRLLELGEDLRVRLVRARAPSRSAGRGAPCRSGCGGCPPRRPRRSPRRGSARACRALRSRSASCRERRAAGSARRLRPAVSRSSSATRADRIGRRAEPPAFGGLAQPVALVGHEDVRVVVAGRRAVERRERVDDFGHVRARSASGAETRSAAGARRSSSVTSWVSGSSDGSPAGRAARADRAWRRGVRSGGSTARGAPRRRFSRSADAVLTRRRDPPEASIARTAHASPDRPTRDLAVRSGPVQHVPAVEPGELLPPCHSLILLWIIRGFAVRSFAVRGVRACSY